MTYYISLYVGAKRLVFHLSQRDGHVIIVSGCLILTADNLIVLIRMVYITKRLVKLCKIYCDIWHRLTWTVCTGGRTLRHNKKFSRMDSLPNFLTHGAPLRARFARESSANTLNADQQPWGERMCIAWRNRFLLPLEFVTWFAPDDAYCKVIIYLCRFTAYLFLCEKMCVLWLLLSENTTKSTIEVMLYVTDDQRMLIMISVGSLLLLLQLLPCAGKLIEIFIGDLFMYIVLIFI